MDGNFILPYFTCLLAQANQGLSPAQPTTGGSNLLYGLGVVLGIAILPFVISNFVCKAIRLPTHATRFGFMLLFIALAFFFAWESGFKPKLGPDMQGGTTMVYNIVKPDTGQAIDPGQLATALSGRINPSGTKEISIRPRGDSQIEITVPATDPDEVNRIKKIIEEAGQLEFRIVANRRKHMTVVDLARKQTVSVIDGKRTVQQKVMKDDREIGRWYKVRREVDLDLSAGIRPLKTPVLGDVIRDHVTGKLIEQPDLRDESYALEKWMKREGIEDVDVLMAFEHAGAPYTEVTGDDLSSAALELGKSGYEVNFKLGSSGGRKMGALTGRNTPDGDLKSRMAIIMDGEVLSAPNLNSTITTDGVINGNFSREEVEFLVTILRAGRLPAALDPDIASEERVGAGLGATTVEKGKTASFWAVVVTFICILTYYRFSGIVASIALIINGLLIFGIMVFIGQPLTLPGLAGLVLTIGMSVDANVLIFERIREEKEKGSAPRMSIRNGFDRAFTTIIDSNLTTLIAAVVLYWIGTDQVRGFAVALIIGIATSFFTATFCSRIIFDFAEKLKIVGLSMSDGVGFLKRTFLGNRDIDFMSMRRVAFPLSVLLIALGLVGVFMRGKDLLNIDFTGGTSVTFQLNEPMDAESLRVLTKKILVAPEGEEPIQSKLVSVERPPQDTVYTLVTSIDKEETLAKLLVEGFRADGKGVKTYDVKILGTESSAPALESQGSLLEWNNPSPVKFVAYQEEETAPAEGSEEKPQGDAAQSEAGEPASETNETETAPGTEDAAEVTSDLQLPASDPASEGESTDTAEAEEDLAVAVPADISTTVSLEFAGSTDGQAGIPDEEKGAVITSDSLLLRIEEAAKAVEPPVILNLPSVRILPEPLPENWSLADLKGHKKWKVSLPTDEADARAIVGKLKESMADEPLWLSLSTIGSKVAGEMQQRAIGAILLSLVFIVAYIWFRFQKVAYGLAAVVALVHDVMITLGVLALCHWLFQPLSFLMIEDFKIGLTEVAAFLTIIGYSLNDTIVVFDRIREVRGRSPHLNEKMVNESVNQTLSRTLLTSGTTLVTVLLLYIFGGEGIHTFAFALLIGVLVGTYSSVFIASPVLLWFSNQQTKKSRVA